MRGGDSVHGRGRVEWGGTNDSDSSSSGNVVAMTICGREGGQAGQRVLDGGNGGGVMVVISRPGIDKTVT